MPYNNVTPVEIVFAVIAFGYIISGIDDLIVDVSYAVGSLIRAIRFPRWRYPWLHEDQLHETPQKKAALLISAWHEDDVIAQSVLTNAQLIDYQNYDFYIGTYPNDEATQAEVDRVCRMLPNVYKAVTSQPGPTSKGDCLNHTLQELQRQEQKSGQPYEFVLMHDPEDVMHPLEMKLCNFLLGRPGIDMVQTPVFPLEAQPHEFTAGTYMDEFAEVHTKDMCVREWIGGFVPSAGVGTAIARGAFERLIAGSDENLFASHSLTEDYDLGMRLKLAGLRGIFVRQAILRRRQNRLFMEDLSHWRQWCADPAPADGVAASSSLVAGWRERMCRLTPLVHRVLAGAQTVCDRLGIGVHTELIATRAYFPHTFHTAVRQRTRWTLGIVFQSWKNLGWQGPLPMRWLLLHDRKGVVSYLWVVMGYCFVIYVLVYQALRFLLFSGWPPPLPDKPWIVLAVQICFLLMFNRLFQRAVATTRIYGLGQGLLSLPRQVWDNVLNMCAAGRASLQFLTAERNGRRLTWDKTQHYFPTTAQLEPFRRRLGELLVEGGQVTPPQLESALQEQSRSGKRLGEVLLAMGAVDAAALEDALQRQKGATASASAASPDGASRDGASRDGASSVGASSVGASTDVARRPAAGERASVRHAAVLRHYEKLAQQDDPQLLHEEQQQYERRQQERRQRKQQYHGPDRRRSKRRRDPDAPDDHARPP